MILTLANQKGGVGKTTSTVNLGAALAETGRRVLVVDLDSQANASALLGVRDSPVSLFDVLTETGKPIAETITSTPLPNVDLIPGSIALSKLEGALSEEVGAELLLRDALEPVTGYDVILIDNNPKLNLSLKMALVAAELAVIPVQCELLALEGLTQFLKTTDQARRLNRGLAVRILMTMYDKRTNLSEDVASEVRLHFQELVLESMIIRSVDLARGLANPGGSVLTYAPTSPAAAAYRQAAAEIVDEWESLHG